MIPAIITIIIFNIFIIALIGFFFIHYLIYVPVFGRCCEFYIRPFVNSFDLLMAVWHYWNKIIIKIIIIFIIITSSNQRRECIRCRNFNTDTLNDFPNWLSTRLLLNQHSFIYRQPGFYRKILQWQSPAIPFWLMRFQYTETMLLDVTSSVDSQVY